MTFRSDERGNLIASFALVMPILVTLAGLGFDYASWLRQQGDLRGATDAAAVAAAREMMLTGPNAGHVLAVADTTVQANVDTKLGRVQVGTSILEQGAALEVVATRAKQSNFADLIGLGGGTLESRSIARLVGGGRICVVGLETSSAGAVLLQHTAQLNGNGCGIYGNSTNPNGIQVQDNARINADLICSAGGANIKRTDLTTPTPTTSCPPMPDPLASRPQPSIPTCTFSSKQTLDGGSHTLSPAVYCGGLEIKNGATVNFQSGTYVFRGGPLEIKESAKVIGRYVGFYFTGPNGGLRIKENAVIDLTAPKIGDMAGVIFWQDRAPTTGEEFYIFSDYVRNLTGAIYLPRGRLRITGNNPVADQSPWTAVIARQVELRDRTQLVLNTNYSATDIPVPGGLKGTMMGAKVYLSQ